MRAHLLVVASIVCGGCDAGSTDIEKVATETTYSGLFSAQLIETTVSISLTGGGTFTCTNTYTLSGTLSMTLVQSGDALTGPATMKGTKTETGMSGPPSCNLKGNHALDRSPTVSGSASDLRFTDRTVAPNGSSYSIATTTSFAGALSSGVVTGSLTYSIAGSGTIGGITSVSENAATTMSVTLR